MSWGLILALKVTSHKRSCETSIVLSLCYVDGTRGLFVLSRSELFVERPWLRNPQGKYILFTASSNISGVITMKFWCVGVAGYLATLVWCCHVLDRNNMELENFYEGADSLMKRWIWSAKWRKYAVPSKDVWNDNTTYSSNLGNFIIHLSIHLEKKT